MSDSMTEDECVKQPNSDEAARKFFASFYEEALNSLDGNPTAQQKRINAFLAHLTMSTLGKEETKE